MEIAPNTKLIFLLLVSTRRRLSLSRHPNGAVPPKRGRNEARRRCGSPRRRGRGTRPSPTRVSSGPSPLAASSGTPSHSRSTASSSPPSSAAPRPPPASSPPSAPSTASPSKPSTPPKSRSVWGKPSFCVFPQPFFRKHVPFIRVAIEYGLCEMLNSVAIRKDAAPKDGNFEFRISELECIFPDGTIDRAYERVYTEMPQWGESPEAARARYQKIIVALADKYPDENLLLVTHGEGVSVSVSAFMKDVGVVEVEYCAYSELRRDVLHQEQSFTAANFTVVSNPYRSGCTVR